MFGVGVLTGSFYGIMRNIKRIIAFLVAVIALSTSGMAIGASDDHYAELVQQAISQIKQGQYNLAVASLDEALATQPSELTGRLALAITLSHTRKIDLAIDEYKQILADDPGNALANYGLATCYLSTGKLDQARTLFVQAGKSARWIDTRPALSYVAYLKGRPVVIPTGAEDGAWQLFYAASLRAKGQADQAQSILLNILDRVKAPGFIEDHGAIVSLNAKSPVMFTGEALTSLPQMRVSANKNMKKVSGALPMFPEPRAAAAADYVTFAIDGSLSGMVNRQPFQFVWDTTKYSNGVHTALISAKAADGNTVHEESRKYWVENSVRGKVSRLTGSDANSMLADLWSAAKLKPSLMLANYYAGKYYLSKEDTAAAAPLLEKAAACNPEFADVRTLLRRCYGRQGFSKVTGAGETSKLVALTFDDGPNANTEALLDTLDLCGVKATFFVVGSQVELRGELVKSMMERGHEIENHTYSHRNMTQLTELEAERELLRGAAAVRSATGCSPAFFRPPGGHLSGSAQAAAVKYGWTGVMWTLACSKFEGGLPDNIIDYISTRIGEGGIILMHNGEDATMKALPAVVTELRNRGYHFVTVSEMVGRR